MRARLDTTDVGALSTRDAILDSYNINGCRNGHVAHGVFFLAITATEFPRVAQRATGFPRRFGQRSTSSVDAF